MSFIRSRIRWLDKTVWFPPFSNPAVASLRPHYCCLLHNPRFACFLVSCRAELSSHNAHYMALACGLPLPPVHTQHHVYFGPGADPWGGWGSHGHVPGPGRWSSHQPTWQPQALWQCRRWPLIGEAGHQPLQNHSWDATVMSTWWPG